MRTKSNKVKVGATTHPRYKWRCYFPGPEGKRQSRFFKTETKARTFAKKKAREVGFEGTEFGGLTADEKAAVMQWRAIESEGKAISVPAPKLSDIVRREALQWRVGFASKSVGEAVARLVEVKTAEGLVEASLRNLRGRLERFATEHEGRPIASFKTSEITSWLLGLKAAPQTTKHYRTALGALFKLAVTEEWCVENPVTDAVRPRLTDKLAGVLKPDQVQAVLENADPRIVPFLAIGFFAGVRVAEIRRLDWKDIDLEAAEIHLGPTITKTKRGRTVEILPALNAFLTIHAKASGPVIEASSQGVSDLLKKATKAAEVASWPHNCCRHSYATAHCVAFNEPGKTAMELGHSGNPRLMHSKYRGEMTKPEAAKYWEIRP
jgi:integrase/recombinase XerD